MKHSLELFEQPIPALRSPSPDDAAKVVELARNAEQATMGSLMGGLAEYDSYKETSVVAELNEELAGAVLAYVLPYDPETLFLWQVNIAQPEEGKGLASLMMGQLMRKVACNGVTRVQTIIPSSDERGWSLFRRFARWQRAKMEIQPFVTQALIPYRRHENHNLVTIRLTQGTEQTT